MSMHAKFGPVVSEENIEICQITDDDDGRQVMTIAHMTLWVR